MKILVFLFRLLAIAVFGHACYCFYCALTSQADQSINVACGVLQVANAISLAVSAYSIRQSEKILNS
jgi:hypothetical protein